MTPEPVTDVLTSQEVRRLLSLDLNPPELNLPELNLPELNLPELKLPLDPLPRLGLSRWASMTLYAESTS
jgi:hypothetical protein